MFVSRYKYESLKVILLIFILLVGGIFVFFNFSSDGPKVSAVGSASLSIEPDEILVYINIEGKGDSASEADRILNEISRKIISGLNDLGLEDEVKLLNYNVYQDYEYTSSGRKQIGFLASQRVVVKQEDSELLAEIVDVVVENEGLINSIQFGLSDKKQREFKVIALEEAGADAKRKAEASAKGLGKKLGKLVSIQTEDFGYTPWVLYDESYSKVEGAGSLSEEVRGAVSGISPNDLDVSARIKVEYRIR
jgi:uncharacterized protein YggE